MSCNCNSNNTDSTITTPPPCINGEPCEEVIDAGCVEYTGANISSLNILKGDRVDTILNKLSVNSTTQNIAVNDSATIQLTGSQNGETTFTHVVNSATDNITLVLDSATNIIPGILITGTNIPSGTKVVSVNGNTIVISNSIIGTVTSETLTFTSSESVGLNSNPLIANVIKSTTYADGKNQVSLLSDGVYVPKPKNIVAVTDNNISALVGGITITVVGGSPSVNPVFDVKTDPVSGAIVSVDVLNGGLFVSNPTDVTITSNLGSGANLGVNMVGTTPNKCISSVTINDAGTGYFDGNYIDIQAKISANAGNALSSKSDGLYAASANTKVSATDSNADYLNKKIVAGTNITIVKSTPASGDPNYDNGGEILTINSTGSTGTNFTVTDTSTIDLTLTPGTGSNPATLSADLILDNKTLVSPIIVPGFSYTKNDGGAYTQMTGGSGIGYNNSDPANPIVDIGAKVILDSYYTWTVSDSNTQSAPTTSSGNWGTNDPIVPSTSGTPSAHLTDTINETTVVTRTRFVTITKPASGLIVSNNKVVLASSILPGTESKTASISVRFKHKYYAGASTGITDSTGVKGLSNKNFTDVGATVLLTDSTTSSQYYYFCFPSTLTSIIQNGALPILGAFTAQTTIVVTNDAGYAVTYNIYKSNSTNPFSVSTNLSFQL